MHEDVSRILFSEQDLSNRVAEMGAAITRDYAELTRDEGLILISVLRGAAIFMADLAREIKLPIEMDYMAISSYGNGVKSSGVVQILKDLSSKIEGRHVLIAEDILDSGLTLTYLMKNLQSRNPASLEVATLLRKDTPGKPTSNAATSASNALMSSSWDTVSITPSAIATCPTSAFSGPSCISKGKDSWQIKTRNPRRLSSTRARPSSPWCWSASSRCSWAASSSAWAPLAASPPTACSRPEFTQAVEQDRVTKVVYAAGDYSVSGTYYPAATAGADAADAFNGAFDAMNARMATLKDVRTGDKLTGVSHRRPRSGDAWNRAQLHVDLRGLRRPRRVDGGASGTSSTR